MRTAGADRGSHGFVRRILVPAGGLVSVLILVCLLFYSFFPLPNRLSVLFIGNPMVLAFWDGGFRDTLLLVPIDSDVTVSSLYGYGDYSLASLWKLGRIEKKGGLLLTTSLEEALGLPIPWFFGPKTESLPPDFDTSGGVPTAWELLRFLNPLTASSNIPMTVRIALWRILASKGGQTEILSFDEKNVYADKQNPDGSTIRILDPDRVENALGTRFEDDRIRREALRVAVYNTTSVPLLAQRVARLLGHVGAVVVSVKNDLEETAACTISGEDTALDSETARFIEVHYGCSHSEEEGDDASDLTVRIGSSYASRFGVLRE